MLFRTGVTLLSTPPSWWVIRNTRVKCVSHHSLSCPRNWRGQIGRTWCLSSHQGYLKGLFSWGWITSGSANCCSCSKFIRGQTQACTGSTVSVPIFLCWKSTLALGSQVIFCILCILCIFWIMYHSMGWTVSICNDLQAPWASTSLVCDSSILHFGTPSSSPGGCNRDNTLCHATRISRLSRSILRQISKQWWWM